MRRLGRREQWRGIRIRPVFSSSCCCPSSERPRRVEQRRGARLDLVQPRAVVGREQVPAARGGGLGRDGRGLGRVAVRALEVGRGGLVAGERVADARDEVVLVGEDLGGKALVGEGLRFF